MLYVQILQLKPHASLALSPSQVAPWVSFFAIATVVSTVALLLKAKVLELWVSCSLHKKNLP